MSRDKSLFEKLPEAGSPESLDNRIVCEARRLAPSRQSRFTPGWIPALATVSLVAVAVVAVRPVFQSLQTDTAVMEAERELSRQESAAPEAKKAERRQMMASDQPLEPQPQPAPTQSLGNAAMQPQPPEAVIAEEAMDEAITPAAETQAVSGAQESDSASASSQLIQSESPQVSEDVNELKKAVSDDDYRRRIEEILALYESGETDEAARRLDDLRSLCPLCELPDDPGQLTLPD